MEEMGAHYRDFNFPKMAGADEIERTVVLTLIFWG